MPIVDAEGAVKYWVNNNSVLSGPGTPMPKGAQLRRLRSPYQGAYALLRRVGGEVANFSAEATIDRARVSAMFYGVSLEGASTAAVAYANAIERIRTRTVMGSTICEFVANITGPTDTTTNQDEPRYLVDADFYLH